MNDNTLSAQHQAVGQAPTAVAVCRSHHSGNILVVDDEVAITNLITETLGEEGYTTRVAHDGASALLDILNDPPALVILDIGMPVMTGDELLRRLRRNHFPDLPIIILTAGMNAERMLDHGATAVLAKPFDLNALLDHVIRYVPLPAEPSRADAVITSAAI